MITMMLPAIILVLAPLASAEIVSEGMWRRPARARVLVVRPPRSSPATRRACARLQTDLEKTDRYDDLILKYALRRNLDPRLVKAIIAAESEFYANAVSYKGARGLMQVMPRTSRELGILPRTLEDPEANIRAGTAYLAFLVHEAWRREKVRKECCQEVPLWLVQRVIAGYHAGPYYLSSGWWPETTRRYVHSVLMYYQSDVSELRIQPFRPRRYDQLASARSGRLML
jgi:soluble lytic murein transglycosylase-like protein